MNEETLSAAPLVAEFTRPHPLPLAEQRDAVGLGYLCRIVGRERAPDGEQHAPLRRAVDLHAEVTLPEPIGHEETAEGILPLGDGHLTVGVLDLLLGGERVTKVHRGTATAPVIHGAIVGGDGGHDELGSLRADPQDRSAGEGPTLAAHPPDLGLDVARANEGKGPERGASAIVAGEFGGDGGVAERQFHFGPAAGFRRNQFHRGVGRSVDVKPDAPGCFRIVPADLCSTALEPVIRARLRRHFVGVPPERDRPFRAVGRPRIAPLNEKRREATQPDDDQPSTGTTAPQTAPACPGMTIQGPL